MPQMGESIFEGTITKWLKQVGDTVQRDEPLFEISTDKVDAEIPSPAAGVLTEIKVPAGQVAQINAVVAVIGGAASALLLLLQLHRQKRRHRRSALRNQNRRAMPSMCALRRWCARLREKTTST